MAAKKIGVLIGGCGSRDGGEIQENVCTLLALARAGAKAVCMALDKDQVEVINHLTGQPMPEKRNMLIEAARIARGQIVDAAQVKTDDLDALILPGGAGIGKNLCTWINDGANMTVVPEVKRLVEEMAQVGKPLGFICLSPVIAAKLLGHCQVELTLGNDPQVAAIVTGWGARHLERAANEIVVDKVNKVVTTPAYMIAKSIAEVAEGIEKLVNAVLELA